MGNRGNIISIENEKSLVFYSHSLGDEMPKILQEALKRYKEKGGDPEFVNSHYIHSYICGELIKASNETLFGCGQLTELIKYPRTFSIGHEIPDNDNPLVFINFDTKTIHIGEDSNIFYSFIRYLTLNLESLL